MRRLPVLEVWRHDDDLPGYREDVKPMAYRRDRYAERGRQDRLLQDLAVTAGDHRQKAAEGNDVVVTGVLSVTF